MKSNLAINWHYLWKPYGRILTLLLALTAGIFIPQAQVISGILKYLLMGMMFFTFIDITINRNAFHISILFIFIANISLPLLIYFFLIRFNPDLALIGFITAITPTATAAPVFINFLHRRVDYAVIAVLATNIGVSLLLPFILPFIADPTESISTVNILTSVLVVIFVPLVLALLTKMLPQPVKLLIRKGKPIAFPLWLLVLFTVTAKASAFLQSNTTISKWKLIEIALLSLFICIMNFLTGWLLGGRNYSQEASQSLGQKNTSFTIWLSLTYLNPLTALGPTFYIVYHNLYNGWQLYKSEHKNISS